jgi:hypothetical protein
MLKNIKFLLISSMLISGILLPTQSIHALWWFSANKTEQASSNPLEKDSRSAKSSWTNALTAMNNNAWSFAKKTVSLAADGIGKAATMAYNNKGIAAVGAGVLASYSAATSYLNQKAKNNKVLLESTAAIGSRNGFHAMLNGAHASVDLAGRGVIGSAKFAWDNPVPTALVIGSCIVYSHRKEIKKQAKQAYNYCKDGATHAAKQAIDYCKNNAGNVVMGAGAVTGLAGAAGLAYDMYRNWESNDEPEEKPMFVPNRGPATQDQQSDEGKKNIIDSTNDDTFVSYVDNFLKDYNKPDNAAGVLIESTEIKHALPESIHSPLPENSNTAVEEDVQEFTRDNRPGASPATQIVSMRASSVKNDTPPNVKEKELSTGDYSMQQESDDKSSLAKLEMAYEERMRNWVAQSNPDSNGSAAKMKVPSTNTTTDQSDTFKGVYDRAADRLKMILKHIQPDNADASNIFDTPQSALKMHEQANRITAPSKVTPEKIVTIAGDRKSSPVRLKAGL